MKLPSRKFFLAIILTSLGVTAVLGIIAILTRALGDIGDSVIETTVAIDIASVLALCCAGRVASKLHKTVQVIGLIAAGVGLLFGLILIWSAGANSSDTLWRIFGVAGILAVAAAHACLLLPSIGKSPAVRLVTLLTLGCIVIVAELLINYVVIPDFGPSPGYGKALAVVLILDVLGTITIPLLSRFGTPRAT